MSPAAADATLPEPEARGYPGNLGLLFAAHAHSERTAIVDLYVPGRPREVSYRALDASRIHWLAGCHEYMVSVSC